MRAFLLFISIAIANALSAQNGYVIHSTVLSSTGTFTQEWKITNDNVSMSFNHSTEEGEHKVQLLAVTGSNELIIVTSGPNYQGYYKSPTSSMTSSFGVENLNPLKGISEKSLQKYTASNKHYQFATWMDASEINIANFAPFFKDELGFKVASDFNSKGFPMKSIITNHNGELVYSFEVTSISKSTFSKSDFEIPTGYEEIPLTEKQEGSK